MNSQKVNFICNRVASPCSAVENQGRHDTCRNSTHLYRKERTSDKASWILVGEHTEWTRSGFMYHHLTETLSFIFTSARMNPGSISGLQIVHTVGN